MSNNLLLHPLEDISLQPDTQSTTDLYLTWELILSNEFVHLSFAKSNSPQDFRESQELHLVVVLHFFLRVLLAQKEI